VALAPCPSASDVACGPPGVDESHAQDLDGVVLAVGAEHRYTIEALHSQLRAGYVFHRYWAQGREQAFTGHELRAALRSELPLRIPLFAVASDTWRPFDHASTVPNAEPLYLDTEYPTQRSARSDRLFAWRVGFERPITDGITWTVAYSRADDQSNVAYFRYDRQVVGTYLTLRLGRR
jgi:hypothetical protein